MDKLSHRLLDALKPDLGVGLRSPSASTRIPPPAKSEVLMTLTNPLRTGFDEGQEVGGIVYSQETPHIFSLRNPQKQGARRIPGKTFNLLVRAVLGLGWHLKSL